MQIIGLIAALVAMVWLAVLIRRGGLIAGLLAVVVGGSVFGHAFFHVSVVTLDRALLAMLFGFYLVTLAYRREWPRRFTPPDLYLLLAMVALFFSTFLNDWRVDDLQPASRFLFLFAMPAAIYWLGRECKLETSQAVWVTRTFIVFGTYLALTAIAEMLGLWSIIFPRYIVTSDFTEFLGRGRGPFLNPSANGIFMTTGLTCALMSWPRASGWQRYCLAIVALVMLGGCFATLTRCVWLGTALGIATIVWMCFPVRIRWGILTLMACLLMVTVATNWSRLNAFKRDKDVPVSAMTESARLRPMLAAVAWQMVQDRPLTGFGLGQYSHHNDAVIAERRLDMPLDQVRPYHQHNFVLSLLTETGLIGTLPFLALLLSWAMTANRLWKLAAVPYEIRRLSVVFLVALVNYIANGMFQDVTIIPMVNLLLFFLAGVVMSAALAYGACVGWPHWNLVRRHSQTRTARHAVHV